MYSIIFLQLTGGDGSNPLMGMLFPFLILAVFYFMIIRPQMNRQKETTKFQESLKEGMDVVTTSGIIGKITRIEGNAVRLMVDDKTFLRVLRSAVQGEYKA